MATNFRNDYPSSTNDESDGVAQDTIDQEEEEDKPANKNVAYVLKRLQSSGALIKKPKQDISAPSRNDCPSSTNDESDGVAQDIIDQEEEEDQPASKNVAYVLKRLQSSGALIKKPKQEHRCYTCDEDFPNWEELENHLIQHVSLPTIYLVKLPSDNEDSDLSGDENWSDEDEAMPSPNISAKSTPQKIDISQIMKKTGISITKPAEKKTNDPDSALSKLSGLGFTIKKGSTPIKQERSDTEQKTDDVIQKLGQLGGIKLKLKSDGNNMNTFKVINGLKDFKTSDDEDDGSGNDDGAEDHDDAFDDEQDKSGEHEGSGDEHDFGDDENVNRKVSVSDNSGTNKISLVNRKIIGLPKNIQTITPKTEPVASPTKPQPPKPSATQVQPVRSGRPTIKQTPKRGANLPVSVKETPQQVVEMSPQNVPTVSTSNNRESNGVNIDNVVVKQEADTGDGSQSSNVPLFSGQIKSERTTPPLNDSTSTPVIATIKSEPESTSTTSQELFHGNQNTTVSTSSASFLPVTKTEDNIMTVIEINGDSNDEDDDCCVVSATPAPDVKPIVPKTENLPSSYPPPISYPTQPSYSSSAVLSSCQMSSAPSTLKQHNFNWNAPDSKPAIDMLEKSADDIFDSLLSSATKKENNMSSDVSEYISLDTLGPQHSCDICNTRFTDVMLLEEHIRTTGHSKSIIAPSSSNLLPYNPQSGNILSTLLPVKQLAEQVGKLSGMGGSGPGFTHQQNVMINIQAYPGSGGVMGPPPPYNAYASGQNMHSGFGQTVPNNMYMDPGQMPGQYPGQNFMGQSGYGQQFQSPMSKAGYSGPMPQGVYSTPSASPAFSSASPLQGMQQAAYGQNSAGLMNTQMGQMGPPGSSPNHPYVPVSSPGGPMKPATGASGIKIQNVQTFPPGQLIGSPGQQLAQGQSATPVQGGPKSSPNQIRVASTANVVVGRPRMPSVRGARPSIRPGIMVHGQVRGAKPMAPRMPLKRPGTMTGGPNQKRRPDMLLPGKHDNEDCQVMAMQKQRDGLPMIQSVQGAKDKLNIGSQISITKKTVNKEANAMANVLASRGISVVQKQKSRSPTPERPVPHIPNLGAGVSIKHTSKSSNFSIPEAKVGGGMLSCKICKKMFMNQNSLSVHMSNAHPQSKMSAFKCDECPASYPTSLQLQHHKRVFHNVTGPNRELGLPVVDLSHEDNLKRLSNLGIYSFIPLANREQTGGCFGIPVISVHNAQNGYTNNLQALGADGLLTLGPLKPLPKS